MKNLDYLRLAKPLKHCDSNVVYIPTLKAASTYFETQFKKNNFFEINYSDIDWKNTFAFSHIIHPIKRRNKGIAQFIHSYVDIKNETIIEKLKLFPELLNFLYTPYIDEHSAPLHLLYKGFIENIHFIPIDVDSFDYYCYTSKLLKKHNIEIDFPREKIHVSNKSKKELYWLISKQIKPNSDCRHFIELTFNNDIKLYKNAIKKLCK